MSYDIDYIQIQLASPKEIERWSQRILPNNEIVGEITKADTINYRTFKPERDGLFCERIFGSMINNECSCGKTRRRKPMQMHMPETLDNEMTVTAQKQNTDEITGYVCPTCGVEPTDAKVRRYRMGCIRLRKPGSACLSAHYSANNDTSSAIAIHWAACATGYARTERCSVSDQNAAKWCHGRYGPAPE